MKRTTMYLTQQVRKLAQVSHVPPPLQECLTEGCSATQHMDFSSCPPLSSGPPIVSEEELTCLAMISPANTSQYAGSRVKALIQILQHQMDQQELVKEFMVCECALALCLKLPRHLPNCCNHRKLLFIPFLFFTLLGKLSF